jgi:hypothetical protein
MIIPFVSRQENTRMTHSIPKWRIFMWNLGWWLPFLPAKLRRKLFGMIKKAG